MGVDGASTGETSLLVERHRLLAVFEELDRGTRVVGVWAPAGSGKTSLLRQWIAATSPDIPVVDATDEGAVIDAVARVRAAATDPAYLVVDSMEAASARVREAITAMIDDQDPRVRIVLAGRFDPLPASPSRWVVSREIREADLTFTVDEAEAFFATGATRVTSAQLTRILARTGGWAAALVLLRHVLDGRDDDAVIDRFDGDSRPVAEYLVSELLMRLAERDREVLVWSAVGRRVPMALAAALTDRVDAGSVLDELVRTNSLVRREDETFVFHPILATFLGAEQRRRDIVRAGRGHARAAAWFAERNDLRGALSQLMSAADAEALTRFIEDHGYDLVFSGDSGQLMRAVRQLPAPARERLHARLRLLLDVPHFAGRTGTAHPDRVRDGGARADRKHPVDDIVDVLRAHAAGHADAVTRLQERTLLEAAGRSRGSAMLLEYAQVWTSEIAEGEHSRVADRLVSLGSGTEGERFRWLRLLALESALSVIATSKIWVDVEPVFLAIRRDLNNDADVADSVSARALFAHAAQSYHRAEALPRATLLRLGSDEGSAVEPAMRHIARTLVALDDLTARSGARALAALTELFEGEIGDWPISLAYAAVPWMHSALWHGQTALADRILFRCRRVLGSSTVETLTAAFVRRPDRDAERALRGALDGSVVKVSPLALAYAWVALAVHAHQRGREATATEDISQALQCAAPLGAIRPFLHEGDAPVELLRSRIDRLGTWRTMAETILDCSSSPDVDRVHVTSLSPRERDLLRELPAHQSIGEIAAHRQVSVNTIKSQVRSLYNKLGVQNRADAVTEARRLGLL